jgi:alpha-galactosidase
MLENPAVIAIDQDALAIQGTPIDRSGAGQVWTKPLAGGDRAVALLNRRGTPIRLTTSAHAIGLGPAARYRIVNVWSHTTKTTSGAIDARVPPHGTVLYRVSAV